MPIDPRIALGVQAPQIESPMNVMANALKLRAMQNENALFEQQQRQAAAQEMERNRLRSLLAGGASPEQLMRSGFFEQGAKLGEFGRQQSAEERAQAEEARKAEEAAASRRKAMFGVLSVAKNPETYRTAREIAQGMGLDLTGIPEEFPGVEYINTLEDSLLTPQERAERAAKARTASIEEGKLRVSQGQLGVSQGQLDVSRGRLELERDKEAREAAKVPEGRKPPENYEYAPDGTLRFIKGGPADPDVIAAKKRAEQEPAAQARAAAANQGIATVNASLTELRNAYKNLYNMGAIPSETVARTGPSGLAMNVAAYAAASETGQRVGRALGSKAQTERDVINAARMRLNNAIMRATGMTSQQMNSNFELQAALSTLGNPQSSFEANTRILDYLEKFVRENYAGDALGAGAAPGSAPKATVAPAGVPADVWGAMTPEERALWQNKR